MRTQTGAADDLVGRDDELTVVRATLDSARSGRPTLALLMGEAGIGKTRLADEAAVVARAAGMRVLRGEADSSRREPMDLWQGVFRSLGAYPAGDQYLAAEERRWDHLESLADALTSAAPVLVILEDLHWADSTAVWVLDHLPRTLGDTPVAFIVTCRDHEPGTPPLDELRRVARLVQLEGLDVDGVAQLAASETDAAVDVDALHARTGGNPLFVRELVRSPDGVGVISAVLDRSFDRFDLGSRELLATVALAGTGTPLAVLALAADSTTDAVTERLDAARQAGILGEVTPAGVRFQHALLAEAAARLTDGRALHGRLAAAWSSVPGLVGRTAAAGHRLRSVIGSTAIAGVVDDACEVAAELVTVGEPERAAGLLREAHAASAECVDRPELRARVALDLAQVLRDLGDLELALVHYGEATELARAASDPLTRARAEVGAELWIDAFVPDPARVRRLEDALDALDALPGDQLRVRNALLERLTVVGGADPDAGERVRVWADEAVATARGTGDPVLLARALINQTTSPWTRAELDDRIAAADEVVRLAEHAGRPDIAIYGHQRRVSHHLGHGDLSAAHQSLARAELLAGLLPAPWWRHRTLLQRTTLLALMGDQPSASASMYEAVRTGADHVESVVLLGCELMHQMMLLDLYGHPDARVEEVYRSARQLINDVPSPVLQVHTGFGAQLLGDEPRVHELLALYGAQPDRLLRSMTGDHLLRVLGDIVARAGATKFAEPVYRALLPYAGLLNVGDGQCAGLPVDDVLGRLAALRGDAPTAVRHARDAVALTRAMPAPPLLVHCLDHLADALEHTGEEDAHPLRAEADALAVEVGVARPGREPRRASTDDRRPLPSAVMRRDGNVWTLTSPLGEVRLPTTTGLGQLARLLRTPGAEVSAVDLAGRTATPVAADLGPRLDAQAKRAYRQRVLELQSEIDDAEAANDPVRGEQAHVEMDALLRELKQAVGLGGRDRPSGSDTERSRVNVVRSLGRAITTIADRAPLLGEHLRNSVRTGHRCIYLPEPSAALTWTVQTAGD